jgi:hypothetical protein
MFSFSVSFTLFIVIVCCFCLLSNGALLTFTEDKTTNFVNPSRGFYKHYETHAASYQSLSKSSLEALSSQPNRVSLILRLIYLEPFTSSQISASVLAKIDADFDIARSAGVKMILRFAYVGEAKGWPPATPYGDATSPSIVHAHLDQLKPIVERGADVIAVVQAG